MNLLRVLRKNKSVKRAVSIEPELPLKGFEENRVETPFVEFLTDSQLTELNSILKWNCFTVDKQGRRFGRAHSAKKRAVAQPVPDNRIVKMHEKFNLSNKTVLEVGCFEGVHTVALAQRAKKVIAIDSRMENIVKTMVRLGFFNESASVFCCNLEDVNEKMSQLLRADFIHHVGVLYHLKDPVPHLLSLPKLAPQGLMLDTHYASPEMANKTMTINGESFRYFEYKEPGGYAGVFSGMYEHAKWLTLEDLKKALIMAGYKTVEVVEDRVERNGPRLTLYAY